MPDVVFLYILAGPLPMHTVSQKLGSFFCNHCRRMVHFIKAVVATPKRTFKSSTATLDLAYITPRLIVAAGPTDTSTKAVFRDNIAHVVAHLDKAHGRGNWHVWNLRGEGPGYAFNAVVGPHCSYRPFPDHQVPTLELMDQVVGEIHSFLTKSPYHVALIHCKEGKGRSGTVCCGFLMYEAQKLGILVTVEEMVAKFTAQRMRKMFGPGVSIDSQLRFLSYWRTYLQVESPLRNGYLLANDLEIGTVVFYKPHRFLWRLSLVFYKYEGLNLVKLLEMPLDNKSNSPCYLKVSVPLAGVSLVKMLIETSVVRCYCWFSPYFETISRRKRPVSEGVSGNLKVTWDEWDGFWGTKWKGPVKLFEAAEVLWNYRRVEPENERKEKGNEEV